MKNDVGRNTEYDEAINTDKKNYLNCFVDELDVELADMEQLMSTESSKIIVQWVRDKLHKLHGDFNADL